MPNRYHVVSMYSGTDFLLESPPTQNVHHLMLTMVNIYLVLLMCPDLC